MSASPSISETPGDTGGGVGCCTATCLLGRSQLVFLLALRFFLAKLLWYDEVSGPMNCQGLVLYGPLSKGCVVGAVLGGREPGGSGKLMGLLGGWREAALLQEGVPGPQDYSSHLRHKPRTLLGT